MWIFTEIIIPFIRANFYVTEKHAEYNAIFYYRKQVWKLVSKLAIRFFEERNLDPIDKEKEIQLKYKTEYPISKLRILPKKDSFRPIMTFFRKPNKKQFSKYGKKTLNHILTDSQIVLRNLKDKLGTEVGFSVFDNTQIF